MKIRIIGRQSEPLVGLVQDLGFTISDRDPELIIAHGGDGALIGAERLHPGIPKIGIRESETCVKCPEHEDAAVLQRLKDGTLDEQRLLKIRADRGNDSLEAMNDIIFRNQDPRSAVRFVVALNGQTVTEEMIGDGLVACTPFGSSAYFRSITRMMIRTGIGIAFNNCTDLLNHLVIGEDERIDILIRRGPAVLAADNDADMIALESGDHLQIRRAHERARILAIDTLRCSECRYVHAPRRRY